LTLGPGFTPTSEFGADYKYADLLIFYLLAYLLTFLLGEA